MRTREPILTRGRDHWDRVNLPVAEFRERLDNVREAMAAEGLDALLLYGTGDRDGDIAYVSNLVHKVPGFPLAVVVTPETVVVLNQRSSRTRPIVERSTWIDDVRFTRDLWATFDEILAEVADSSAEVGLVGADAMAYPAHEALAELRSNWSTDRYDGFLDELRARKSTKEQDQLRRSGRLLQEVDQFLESDVTAPIGERRLEAALDRFARLTGAQDVRVLLSNPEQTEAALRPAEPRRVTGDAPISIYLAARFEGYWSALARTVTLDNTSPPGFDDLIGGYERLGERLEPGEDAGAFAEWVRDELAGQDLDLDPRYPLLGGIGLELDEWPSLDGPAESRSFEFEPGMALELILAVRRTDAQPLFIGDTAIITDDGAEFITR